MEEVRFDGDLGFGCSRPELVFSSGVFTVNVWKHQNGKRKTEVVCSSLPDGLRKIYFKGELNIYSDVDCIKLYRPEEVMLIIDGEINAAFERGKKKKIDQIKDLLLI